MAMFLNGNVLKGVRKGRDASLFLGNPKPGVQRARVLLCNQHHLTGSKLRLSSNAFGAITAFAHPKEKLCKPCFREAMRW